MMGCDYSPNNNFFSFHVYQEDRVRKDHPLRKMKELIDFDFICHKVMAGTGHEAKNLVHRKKTLHSKPEEESSLSPANNRRGFRDSMNRASERFIEWKKKKTNNEIGIAKRRNNSKTSLHISSGG